METATRPVRHVAVAFASGRGVAHRWRAQYARHIEGEDRPSAFGKRPSEVAAELDALGPDPKIEDVERVIGNQSWTRPFCAVCSDYILRAAVLGNDERMTVCAACLRDALDAITQPSNFVQ
jgi:hypothetical protein